MRSREPVTERDLRAPEFRDCEPEDLEWRDDGTLARKDRWEQGIRQIAGIVGLDPRRGFEVADVVAQVHDLVRHAAENPIARRSRAKPR